MPNDDNDKDIKVEISFNEICSVIAKTMGEEPFDSLIEENPLMIIIFAQFGAKVTTKLFADKIKKGDVENGRSN